MKKILFFFAAALLSLGAGAQDYIIIDRTFDLTCTYPVDWNDMTEEHLFSVYGTYSHPYDRSGSIEFNVDYGEDWMDMTGGMLQPGDEIMSMFSITIDSTEWWHSIQFRIIDSENETIYIEPFQFVGIQESDFIGIEDKVYTGEALTQENLSCYSLYSDQYQITNYRNNIEVGTAYFDVIGVYPYSIGRATLSFQILDANNPEWTLLQDLRTAVANQGNEDWVNYYWPTNNGIAGVSQWQGVAMSDGHVTELSLRHYSLHLDSIPQAAFRFPYLTALDVADMELTGNIEDIVNPTDIPCAASLTTLYLGQNRFTGNVGALAQLFPNLINLDVSGNKITDVDPMISPNVTNIGLYSQQIDSVYAIDFRAPLSREGLMASLPSLLLYNHDEQAYVKDASLYITPSTEDYDAWYMCLYAGMDPEYYGTEFRIETWMSDPAFRYGNGDTLYVQGNDGTCRAKILFTMCDANFNAIVDIEDLQAMINNILGNNGSGTTFNLTATDLYRDSILNVQDIVRMVDTLLTHEVPMLFEAPRRTPEYETTDASLYWLNGDLHLCSSKAVASMQIEIATEGTVSWDLNNEWIKGERANGTKAVIYSLNGAAMPAETDIVLAHCTGEASVRAAVLSDKAAKRISAQLNSPAVVTGIDNGEWLMVNGECQKMIRSGRLIIIRGNKMYNAQGIEL